MQTNDYSQTFDFDGTTTLFYIAAFLIAAIMSGVLLFVYRNRDSGNEKKQQD